MTELGIATLVGLAVLCLGIAFGAIWLLSRMDARAGHNGRRKENVNYLLDGDKIIDLTTPAESILIDVGPTSGYDWHLLFRAFHKRFPQLPDTATKAVAMSPFDIKTNDANDKAVLKLEIIRGKLRVALQETDVATDADRHMRIRQTAQLNNVGVTAGLFPHPIWIQSADGGIEWVNSAYFRLRKSLGATGEDMTIPEFGFSIPDGLEKHEERVMLQDANSDSANWFSVTKSAIPGGETLGFAIDINTVITAEMAQRKFVQTLTKTFAQLSTGLAIFDRDRQLVLFNPALIDLLALPADFLSARPTLLTFFDRLRDSRMMPEPKDYANWRQQITDLVIASVDGRFQETWTIPSGLTYRVTGRPHPDGAIALLFEDISAEISLTRRFRTQLNLSQSVIDTLDEAIAVFAPTGSLSFSNRAFRKLWRINPDTSFADLTFRDAMAQWKLLAKPGPFWIRLREYFDDPNDRSEWFSDIVMKDGAALECRVTPLAGGATLVGFSLQSVLEPTA